MYDNELRNRVEQNKSVLNICWKYYIYSDKTYKIAIQEQSDNRAKRTSTIVYTLLVSLLLFSQNFVRMEKF